MADEIGGLHLSVTPEVSDRAFLASGTKMGIVWGDAYYKEAYARVRGVQEQVERANVQAIAMDKARTASLQAQAQTMGQLHATALRQDAQRTASIQKVAASHVSAFSQITSGMKDMAGRAYQSWSSMSEGISNFGRQVGLTAFNIGMIGTSLNRFVTVPFTAATGAAAMFGLKMATTIENATVSLKAFLQNGENVDALIQRLTKESIASPVFDLGQILDFTKGLIGAGQTMDSAEAEVKSLDKIFTTYGVTGDAVNNMLLGFSQIQSKGVAQSEELTKQISQSIPIWSLLSQVTGVSQAKLREMVKDKDISGQMFADLVVKMGELPAIMQGSAEGAKTLSAQWSMMKENLQTRLGVAMIDQFPQIKLALAGLAEAANGLVDAFVLHLPKMIEGLTRLIKGLDELSDRYKALTPAQKESLDKLITLAVIGGPALLILGRTLSGVAGAIQLLSLALNPVALVLGGVALGFAGIALVIATAQGDFDTFRGRLRGFWLEFKEGWEKKVKPAFEEMVRIIKGPLMDSMNDFAKALGFENFGDLMIWLGKNVPIAIAFIINAISGMILVFRSFINITSEVIAYCRFLWAAFQQTQIEIDKLKLMWYDSINFMFGIFNGFVGAIKSLLSGWIEAVKTLWQGFLNWISNLWGSAWSGISGAFSNFQSAFLGTLSGFINTIGDKWASLMDLFRTPINFVITEVYGKGIKNLIGLAGSALGLNINMPDVPAIGAPPAGAKHFASGGIVPGSAAMGDWIPAFLTAGERVLSLSQVSALGGHKAIDRMVGGGGRGDGHYDLGGIVAQVAKLALHPGTVLSSLASLTSGIRDALGAFIPGPAGQMAKGTGSKLLDAAIAKLAGSDIAPSAGLGGDASDSVNAIVAMAKTFWSGAYLTSGSRPGSTSLSGASDYHSMGLAADIGGTPEGMIAVAKGFYGIAGSLLEEIHSGGSGYFVKNGNKVGADYYGAEVANHFDHVHIAARNDALKNLGTGGGTLGAGQLDQWILAASKYVNIEWIDGLKTLIMRESGGNPNAINLTDSNAQAGYPSQGLMQTIPQTFAAYRNAALGGITDPVANIVAGMNYIHSRYGSLYNVPQANASMAPQGYARGVRSAPAGQAWVGENGPELMNFRGGESVTPVKVGGDIYLTVTLGDEVIADKIQVALDRDNKSKIDVLRSGRRI